MPIQLSDAAILINDEVVAIVPNTLKYTEGFGEQQVRAASVGGGSVEQIYSRDVETSLSKVMFDLHTTPSNVKLARSWKSNGNENVAQIAGKTTEGDVTRTFTQAAMTSDPEIEIGTEGVINIEFMSNAAI
jgi:hypothetical protein